MPDISVVVPTFNRAPLIGETLDAILAQTLGPDEIIVVAFCDSDDLWEPRFLHELSRSWRHTPSQTAKSPKTSRTE